MERPELTFPAPVARLVEERYRSANTILEYGSGGSTVLAAELGGKTVFAVESDRAWAERLTAYLDGAGLSSGVVIHHADIGPTGVWGKPADPACWQSYVNYPLSVWEREKFTAPDVVLVDGRFRTACFLACLFMTPKPVTILFDDYGARGRTRYHVVEEFLKPVMMVERMAVFDAEPATVPRERFAQIVREFFNVSMVPSFYKNRDAAG